MNWSKYGDRWKNSVLQINVTQAVYDPARPYSDPKDKEKSASAFIVDIERGLICTNAHIVANAISITGRLSKLGKVDISIELVGICRERDLALCRIVPSDIELILRDLPKERYNDLNMIFGDNMELKETDEVMTIGFPLGQENIKYTTGIVAGFESGSSAQHSSRDVEDARARSPANIQITAAINPGNSGGPLLNSKGEVVGIISSGHPHAQNIGYAIPVRTFLSIYCELLKGIVKMPTLSLEWNKTNRELMREKTNDEGAYGIYVRKVHPDSTVDSLETGDIIKRFEYQDTFWASKEAFNCVSHLSGPLANSNRDPNVICASPSINVICYFDRYGDMKVGTLVDEPKSVSSKPGGNEPPKKIFKQLINRKMHFSEVMDMVPVGSAISMHICRDKEWYVIESHYNYKSVNRISHVYPRLEPIDYEIFAGLCCSNLNLAHVSIFENLDCYLDKNKNRYRRRVVICQVFPDTSAFRTQVLEEGDIIKKINDIEIETLDDIRKILLEKPINIRIETVKKSFYMIPTDVIISEDKKVIKNFNIRTRYSLN